MVALEAVVLLVLGVVEVAALHTARLAMGLSTALFFIAAGAGLGLCAWGLWRVRRAARGPVLMAQLVALGLAWNFRASPTTAVAVVLALAAVVGLVGMLHPASVRALEEREGASAD